MRLKEIVGLGNAMELILSGDLVDAEHAYRIGLVDHPVDESDSVRVLGVDEVAGEDQLHRVAEPDDLLEPHQRPVAGVEAPARVLEPEAGVGGAEANVGRKGELEPPDTA